MPKAEKNYKRDYGHKDSAELAMNYTRDGMREELDRVLEKVAPDELTADEQEYLDGRGQCRNHTLNIRFNDTEWEHICRQAELLRMKKSSYVRECAKAHYVLMMDQSDMNGIIGAVRALSTNVNQIARRVNSTGRVYSEDITTMKESVNAIWQLLSYIRSATQCAEALNTSWTGIRPEVIRLSSLLCARQNPSEQQSNSEQSESVSAVVEAPPKPST
ncbi:plasmid mobilization relaxosome protein MobC [Ruminococcus flavefaciens]|uniref:plasmid mobilization protein n=1 Tax=Ruminococcus flavefaciens TaxID=1265 RepID=UPI0013DB41FF|nr:plasmid mobilization relaxosome protein MobC [Ruminococcus flavefaciens]